MGCPNLANKEVKEIFELTEKAIGSPLAYLVYNRNDDNTIDKTPDGNDSTLFKDLLQLYSNDRNKAIQDKAVIYSDRFGQNTQDVQKDENNEPLISEIGKFNKESNNIYYTQTNEIKTKVISPIKQSTIDLSVDNFIKENKLDKIEVENRKRGDKTYSLLFNKANEYNISVKGQLESLTDDNNIEKVEALAGYSTSENKIILDPKYENLNKINQARVLGHEIIHGIIYKEFNKKNKTEQAKIQKDINNYIKDLSTHKKNNPAIQRVLTAIKDGTWQELITYALTDTEFASELNAIIIENDIVEVKPQTFWSKLRDLILSIISDDYTKMDELLNILDYHFNLQKQKELQKKLNPDSVEVQKKQYYNEKLRIPERKINKNEGILPDSEVVNTTITNKLSKFLSDVGIGLEINDKLIIDRNGNTVNAVGKADLVTRIVHVTKGLADINTLPEEAAHIFVALMDKNTSTYKAMFKNISKFDLYNKVVKEYGALYDYNDTKLREEAIGQVISHVIIKEELDVLKSNEKRYFDNWWTNIWNKIKNALSGASIKELEPFVITAKNILNANTKQLQDINSLTEDSYTLEFYEMSPKDKLKRENYINDLLTKRVNLNYADHIYTTIEGLEVENTATSSTKIYYYDMFKSFGLDSEEANLAADKGTYVHELLDYIIDDFKNGIVPTSKKDAFISKAKDRLKKDLPQYRKYEDGFFNLSETNWNNLIYGSSQLMKQIVSNNDEINKLMGTNIPAKIFTELSVYDKGSNTAATIDLAVVYANGATAIYDYKGIMFKSIKGTVYDIPAFKKDAFDIQMSKIKQILTKGYNVTDFAESRIIPINMQLNTDINGEHIPKGIKTIEMWPFNDERDYLMQIPVAGEKTGMKELDANIKKMILFKNKLQAKLKKNYQDNTLKNKINGISKSIDRLILDQDVNYVYSEVIEIAKEFYSRKKQTFSSPNKMSVQDLHEMMQYVDYIEVFSNITPTMIEGLDKTKEKDADTLRKLKEIPAMMAAVRNDIQQTLIEYVNLNNNVNIEESVKETSMIGSLLVPLSEFDSPAFKILSKTAYDVAENTRLSVNKAIDKITIAKEGLFSWAKENNMSNYSAYDILMTESGHLIGRFSKKYTEDLNEAKKRKDITWINSNVNFDKKRMQKDRILFEETLRKGFFGKNKEKIIQGEIKAWEAKYDFTKNNSAIFNKYNKYMSLKDNPSYYNEKFAFISESKNKGLRDYWDMHTELNTEFNDITDGKIAKNFIGEIKKDMIDVLAQNGVLTAIIPKNIKNVIASGLELREFDPSSREVDELGNPIPAIPLRHRDLLTLPISNKEKEAIKEELRNENIKENSIEFKIKLKSKINALKIKHGRFLKSKDLTTNLIQVAETAYSYKYLNDTEDLIKSLSYMLKNDVANTQRLDQTGLKILDKYRGTIMEKLGISTNYAEIFNNFSDMYWYGGINNTDLGTFEFGAVYDNEGKKIEDGRHISKNKLLEGAMSMVSGKAIALKPILAISNALGILSNTYMMAAEEKFYSKGQANSSFYEFISRNTKNLAINKFFEVSARNKAIEKANKLSGSWITRIINMDKFYIMHKVPDEMTDNITLNSMAKNYGIRKLKDGTYELIRLNKLNADTKDVKSIYDIASYNGDTGEINFEDVDLDTNEGFRNALSEFRRLVRYVNTQVKGSVPEEDKFIGSQNLYIKALMQFRTWIPGLYRARFGKFRYNKETNEANVGRYIPVLGEIFKQKEFKDKIITFAKLIAEVGLSAPGIRQLTNNASLFKGNLNTYAAKIAYNRYVHEHNIDINKFTYDDFLELRLSKLRGMATEIGIYLTLFLLYAGSKAIIPDDKDHPLRQNLTNIRRILKKSLLEVSFWMDPSSITQLLKSPFALLGTVTEIFELLINTGDVALDMLKEDDDPYKAVFKKGKRDKKQMFYYSNKFIPGVNTAVDWINPFEITHRQ